MPFSLVRMSPFALLPLLVGAAKADENATSEIAAVTMKLEIDSLVIPCPWCMWITKIQTHPGAIYSARLSPFFTHCTGQDVALGTKRWYHGQVKSPRLSHLEMEFQDASRHCCTPAVCIDSVCPGDRASSAA